MQAAYALRLRRPAIAAPPASSSTTVDGSGVVDVIVTVPLFNVVIGMFPPVGLDRLVPALTNDIVTGPGIAVGATSKNTCPRPKVSPVPTVVDPTTARSEAITVGESCVSISGPKSELPLKM